MSFQFTDYCLLVTENTPHLPLKNPTVIEILAEKSLQPGFARNIAFPNLMRYTKILTPDSWLLTPQNLRLCTSQLWELLYSTLLAVSPPDKIVGFRAYMTVDCCLDFLVTRPLLAYLWYYSKPWLLRTSSPSIDLRMVSYCPERAESIRVTSFPITIGWTVFDDTVHNRVTGMPYW